MHVMQKYQQYQMLPKYTGADCQEITLTLNMGGGYCAATFDSTLASSLVKNRLHNSNYILQAIFNRTAILSIKQNNFILGL